MCEIYWEKNGINKEMTLLHFGLKLLDRDSSILPEVSAKSFQR